MGVVPHPTYRGRICISLTPINSSISLVMIPCLLYHQFLAKVALIHFYFSIHTTFRNITDMSSYGTLISASALLCNAVIETC